MLSPLIAAILVASLLGAREAFRYRLLEWNQRLTSIAAFAFVVAWFGIGLWSLIRLGLLEAGFVLVGSFVIGNAVRIILQRFAGGTDLMSPEADARTIVQHRVASDRAAAAVNAPSLRQVVSRHTLTDEHFLELYEHLMASGIGHEAALQAMTRVDVASWYFGSVPRGERLTLDQSLQLITLARSPRESTDETAV